MNRPKRAEVAELRRRLEADEWLLTGEVGALFATSRFTVDNWINAGKIRYRRTPGRIRECNPEDVRHLLAEYEQVHGAINVEDGPGPALDEQDQTEE